MSVSGQGTTFNLPNYVGELFGLTPTETPFLSMIGGLTGGRPTDAVEFQAVTYDLPTAEQPAHLEGAAAPAASEQATSPFTNVVQIFQYAIDMSYTKLATPGQIVGSGHVAGSASGSNPILSPLDFQTQKKLEIAARDVNWSFINGTYARPNDNATARKTRGMLQAVATNAVAAAGAELDNTLLDALLLEMWTNGAPLSASTVIFANGFQKQRISYSYGYAPMDRTVGGLNIKTVETDFGSFGVVLDRMIPADTILVADLADVSPRFLTIPGKGHFFREELAKIGASERHQLYGEIGLEYGPEVHHGKITGLSTAL